jgi:SAM-dependent methyltransferase
MGEQDNNAILSGVATYYANKLAEHGQTPKGVDWNSSRGQVLRFRQLCRIIQGAERFSLTDLGCGYGALFDYLADTYSTFDYTGVDVSESMVSAAAERYRDRPGVHFLCASEPDGAADYCVASGVFNVRLGFADEEWLAYIESTLDVLDRSSRFGFAFNCLTSYSDAEKMRADLYYADPCRLFDLCKRRYSRNVALLHDYEIYEFTILVRKAP